MKKKAVWYVMALSAGLFLGACILPDRDICILDKGYNWCLNSVGVTALDGAGFDWNVEAEGCRCLTEHENELMETKGFLDPNTADDDEVGEYEALRDLIGAEANYECAKAMEDQGWIEDEEHQENSCENVINDKLADENDAQPFLKNRCDQVALKDIPCGDSGASSSEGSSGDSSTTEEATPTTGDPTEGGSGMPDPYYGDINWGTPSTPVSNPLDCDVGETCCGRFDALICEFVAPSFEGPGRRADYQVAATGDVDLTAGGCSGSVPDSGSFAGVADFSILDCDQDKCPFYLASFAAALDAPMGLKMPVLTLNGMDCLDKEVTSASVELIHAKIGARSSASDRVAFAPGSLSLRLRYELADASVSPIAGVTDVADGQHQVIVANTATVFAEVLEDGTVAAETAEFESPGGDLTLSFSFTSSVIGSPPSSVIVAPGATVECDSPQGATFDLTSASSDVDTDVSNEVWQLDSQRVLPVDVTAALGTHVVGLSTYDERGAVDKAALEMEVVDTTDPVITVSGLISGVVCTRDRGRIEIPFPVVSDTCASSSLEAEGMVIESGGVPLVTPIEIIDGVVELPAGTYTIEWTVEDENGNVTTETQELEVELKETREACCVSCEQMREGSEEPDEMQLVDEPESVAFGLEGDDLIEIDAGNGALVGGLGADMLSDVSGSNVLIGGEGDDELIRFGSSATLLAGGDGDDTITGATADERIFGDAGDDTIFAGGGADWIAPGAGEDQVFAGPGDDTVVFFDTCEYAAGGLLLGGSGTDTLRLPSSLLDLEAAGVVIDSFEIIEENVAEQWYWADCP